MSQRKIFLVIVAVSTVSLLLHHGGHWTWTMEAFYLGCPSLRSHPAPGLKPKHTNVAFLKTHKTASSTMQNLLFRFAERHNLTVAFPVQKCGHQFCYPQSFKRRYVHSHTVPPNIITNHMRFDKKELQAVMPNDTIYITILREPGSMFESLFTYYHLYTDSFKRVPKDSIETFLNEPERYYRATDKDSMYAHNTLAYDLGKERDRPPSDTKYAETIVKEVERSFSLVMISEYFDESLVLLRHLLSWDIEDILYLKLNMRTEGSKQRMTPELVEKTRAWNHLDAKLYDHFNATFWRRIEALGTACVAREVRVLRLEQERLMRSCFGSEAPLLRSAAQIKNKELRPWQPEKEVDIIGYVLPANVTRSSSQSQDFCYKIIMPELQYTRTLLRSESMSYQLRAQKRLSQRRVLTQPPQGQPEAANAAPEPEQNNGAQDNPKPDDKASSA